MTNQRLVNKQQRLLSQLWTAADNHLPLTLTGEGACMLRQMMVQLHRRNLWKRWGGRLR